MRVLLACVCDGPQPRALSLAAHVARLAATALAIAIAGSHRVRRVDVDGAVAAGGGAGSCKPMTRADTEWTKSQSAL